MISFLIQDIFRDFVALGLVDSYEGFCLLLCGTPYISDVTFNDLQILLLSQIVALDLRKAIYGDPIKVLHGHLEVIEGLQCTP